MSLLILPNELLDRIFEDCDTMSIKSSRLTNRRLRSVADPYLLRELPLYYNHDSLGLIDTLVTTQPEMIKGIRAIWFQIDCLRTGLTFEQWNAERQEQYRQHSVLRDAWAAELESHGLPTTFEGTNRIPSINPDARHSRVAQISRDYLTRGYSKYRELVAQQTDLSHSNVVREKCAKLFRKCPKLSSVWITLGGSVRRCTTHQSAYFRQGLLPPCNMYNAGDNGHVRFASHILLAALDAGKRLDTIVFGGLTYNFLTQGQPRMSEIARVFKHVKHLQWDMGETFVSPREAEVEADDEGNLIHYGPNINDAEFDRMHGIFEAGHFSRFIACATNLQTLVINMPELGSTQLLPVDFTDVVGEIHFPHLQRFSLKRVTTIYTTLVKFLLRHKDTLTELRLCDLYMINPEDDGENESWDEFFPAIAGKLPNLEKVCLRGGFHESSNSVVYAFGAGLSEYMGTTISRAMEAYIMRGGEKMPSRRDHRDDFFGGGDRAELMDLAGDAIVPEIRPIGWDISWEE